MAVDLSLTLARDRAAAGTARREMARRLPVESLGDVALVVSELINNALVHGRGEIRLALRLDGGRVWGEVGDGGDAFAGAAAARPGDETGGFGLHIVERLTTRWGVREGKTQVWFEMDLAAESS
jgi:anti-sigma regulatory factor (Ser/Thr protein kinase)